MNNSNFTEEIKSIIEETERLYHLSGESNLSYKFLLNNLSEIHTIPELIAESRRIRHFIVDSYDGEVELSVRVMELFFKYDSSKFG